MTSINFHVCSYYNHLGIQEQTLKNDIRKYKQDNKISILLNSTIMEKINGQTPKNGVVFDTTSNVQPI